jgi:hypothetical protein
MTRLLATVLTAICLASAVPAQEAPIQSTIQSQLNAFQADDFAKAFSFASPTIKGIFVTPENFAMMVRQGYPMVHHPAAVKMLQRRNVAGNLWQRVLITDAEGRGHVLDYQMLETPEGWQINAVQLLPEAGTGA